MTASLLSLFFLLFLALHELGHIIAAKLMKLEIEKVGFTWKPVPHPYVSVLNVKSDKQRILFLIAGPIITLSIFILLFAFGQLSREVVYAAIVFQLILDTNPFYSDFVFMYFNQQKELEAFQAQFYKPYHYFASGKVQGVDEDVFESEDLKNLKEAGKSMPGWMKKTPPVFLQLFQKIYFRPKWYLHFFIWMTYIHFLLSPEWIRGIV